jgi:hypothetical protein
MKRGKIILVLAILFLFTFSLSSVYSASNEHLQIKIGSFIVKDGMIGKLSVVKNTTIYVLDRKGNTKTQGTAKKGTDYGVYSVKGSLYNIGGGKYVKKSSSVKYLAINTTVAELKKVANGLDVPKTIEKNLTLPTSNKVYNIKINWQSNNINVLANNGKVTRPEFGKGDVKVTLVAAVSKNGITLTKKFESVVKELQKEMLILRAEEMKDGMDRRNDQLDRIYLESLLTLNSNIDESKVLWEFENYNKEIADVILIDRHIENNHNWSTALDFTPKGKSGEITLKITATYNGITESMLFKRNFRNFIFQGAVSNGRGLVYSLDTPLTVNSDMNAILYLVAEGEDIRFKTPVEKHLDGYVEKGTAFKKVLSSKNPKVVFENLPSGTYTIFITYGNGLSRFGGGTIQILPGE